MENYPSYAIDCSACSEMTAFHAIATYLLENSSANIALYPDKDVIVVTTTDSDAHAVEHVKDYIAQSADVLAGVTVKPIIFHDECRADIIECEYTPGNILREIIAEQSEELNARTLEKQQLADAVERHKAETEQYRKWYIDQYAAKDRIREQVKAISVLMSSIFPQDK